MNYKDLVEKRQSGVFGPDWVWPKHDVGAWNILQVDWHEHHRFSLQHCKQHIVAISVGGCCGLYPRVLGELFQWVYTFEPDPLNFYCLASNCQKDNITKLQCALGKENGLVSVIRMQENNVGMTEIAENTFGATIPMFTMDSFTFPAVSYMMVDVEGKEHDVLIGAKETIKKHKPVIVVASGEQKPISKFFKDIDYRYIGPSSEDSIYGPK